MVICRNGSIDFFRRCFRAGVVDVLDKSFDDQRLFETHRAHMHEKLQVRNTAQMACDYRELLG